MPASRRLLNARRSATSSIWINGGAIKDMSPVRMPDVLEERPAEQQDEIRTFEGLADLRGVARRAMCDSPGRPVGNEA